MIDIEVFKKTTLLQSELRGEIWDWCIEQLVWPAIKNLEGVTHEDWIPLDSTALAKSFASLRNRCHRAGVPLSYTDFVKDILERKSNHSNILKIRARYEIKPSVLKELMSYWGVDTVSDLRKEIEKRWVNTNLGRSISDYVPSPGNPRGRRYLKGGINLQNCSSEVRRQMTKGGFEYDVESCHIALLQNYALRIGIESPLLDSMIWGKRILRQRIANECQISIDDAKTLMQALTYGAQMTLSTSPFKALGKIIPQKEKQLKFLEIIEPYNEILQKVIDALLEKLDDPDMNWVRQKFEGESKKTRIFRFLETKEWQVLCVIAQSVDQQILVLQHDGLTSPFNVDTDVIIEDIQNRLGLHLMIDSKEV